MGSGKGYADKNPGWRAWAGLCCSTLFPLLSWTSPTQSLKLLPWVAQPKTTVTIDPRSPAGVTGFDLLLAQNLGCKPQSMWLLLSDRSLSSFPEKDLFSKVFSLILQKRPWSAAASLRTRWKPLIFESWAVTISYINHMGSWSKVLIVR